MTPIRTLCIFGTRPEAIKMAPVIAELKRRVGVFTPIVCTTGQHREMVDQILPLFGIVPDIDLALMTANQRLAGLTAALITRLDEVVQQERPDWILAQGDTTTVMAASLVAFYNNVKFGHVEAGLRTGNMREPFPEELNRRVADLVSDAYFAPTERAAAVLRAEGIRNGQIHVTGNTVIDALHTAAALPCDLAAVLPGVPLGRRLVLVTAHRRESFGEPFRELCEAIRSLADRFGAEGCHFVYPVHLNPNVQAPVRAILADHPHLTLLPPLDYLSLVHLMKRCEVTLTDSGGIQEEAPGLGVPVVVMRNTTERPEGVAAGVVRLAGNRKEGIVREASRLLESEEARRAMAQCVNPYGDGQAARRIADVLAAT
ncbi:UDP-N-acetylglucosamine 2-epimerase (non-hydrolyzing) [bacterium]|nr:UDP-N-acetylglucosamine 2-epimerase (non-hydrolyzing) [bacterium]